MDWWGQVLGNFGKSTRELGTVEQTNDDDAIVKWDDDESDEAPTSGLRRSNRNGFWFILIRLVLRVALSVRFGVGEWLFYDQEINFARNSYDLVDNWWNLYRK